MIIQVTKYVKELKNRLTLNPGYFQQLTKKYFKDNSHKLILISDPDPEYLERSRKLESERLEQIVNNLSDARKKEVVKFNINMMSIKSINIILFILNNNEGFKNCTFEF